ncbi:hypothetical protein SAY86_008319 [Trapa natans]|uniref:MPBQ/MBSQ family SAM-binding methyltransferase profile domain-containing protein n=1 Tax=Trapa natans TaxID=22666 RepID=A0AAN7K9A7_TRANT|nr:hypothetical protein SAY86_008319 [Trapa natans]
MRDEALEPADLYDRNMIVVDVGGGTGFTTMGIVKHVDAKNVTILDQSPHQLAKARRKEPSRSARLSKGTLRISPSKLIMLIGTSLLEALSTGPIHSVVSEKPTGC